MNSHFTANANKVSRYHNVLYFLNIDTWYFHIFTFLVQCLNTYVAFPHD